MSPAEGPGVDMDHDPTHVPDQLFELLLVGAVGPTEGWNPVSSFLQVLKHLLCLGNKGVPEQLLQPPLPNRGLIDSNTEFLDLEGKGALSPRIDPVVSGSV